MRTLADGAGSRSGAWFPGDYKTIRNAHEFSVSADTVFIAAIHAMKTCAVQALIQTLGGAWENG
jgi:hypothetical protein